ncbi:ADP/ATP-dependent (S)-NAD(P)H-hydrate dehydratase [Sphingomonas sp.]|uniref:ADP-dependent NAD(P)H-hydrate dehydratase n=1 Tax=Sphingomonas sp. TaxID=28214 RepID=UPI001ECD7AEC|nr:ADP/ATP-dependent (S)-NAD(P)H-hydrate dehydratase [Sphingomonas sp.]MBX3595125.1 NAD(P)H-hydrate dehydratase [Sphingomonas sp.]
MNERPPGAPIIDWTVRRDWTAAARADGTYSDLIGQFAVTIAREAMRFAQDPDILILISPSMGGDSALAAARLMRAAGYSPRIATDRRFVHPTPDGPELDEYRRDRVRAFTTMLEACGERIDILEESAPAPLLIDASFTPLVPFGTPWRHEHAWGAQWRTFYRAASVRIAIDNLAFASPNGESMYLIEEHPGATMTIALGALAAQHVVLPAAPLCGRIVLAPADPPVASDWRVTARPRIDPPAPDAHKYSRGMVVVVGGEMPGAARLAARAAAASGAGYVVLAGKDVHAGIDAIVSRSVETPGDLSALLDDSRIGAVVIGPGLGRSDRARAMLAAALASDRPLVLDADALTLLGRENEGPLRRPPATWITPHFGEWAALSGDSFFESGKLVQTAWWAEEGFGMIFKGADTVIGTPAGAAVLDRLGPSWLSTAGTGDVLSGVLAARLAARQGDWACGAEAVWLHARAAELAGPAFTADELIASIGAAIGECV